MRKGLALLTSFWFGAAMGAAALVLFGLMVGALTWFLPGQPQNLLYHYQTLLTGILAVVAAFFAIRETRRQIAQQYELEEDRRRRRNDAARTALPLALDELCVYADECARMLYGLLRHRSRAETMYGSDEEPAVTVPTERLDAFPTIPTSLVSILSNCVETSEPNVAKAISELSSALQIQNGRVRSMIARKRPSASGTAVLMKRDLEVFIMNASDVYARSLRIFKFARGNYQNESLSVCREDMKSALISFSIYEERCPWIWERIGKTYPPRDPAEENDAITIELPMLRT